MRENACCMVFHVKWISHNSSPNPTLVASDSGGIRRLVVRKSISHGKPNKMHIILRMLAQSEGHSDESWSCLSLRTAAIDSIIYNQLPKGPLDHNIQVTYTMCQLPKAFMSSYIKISYKPVLLDSYPDDTSGPT